MGRHRKERRRSIRPIALTVLLLAGTVGAIASSSSLSSSLSSPLKAAHTAGGRIAATQPAPPAPAVSTAPPASPSNTPSPTAADPSSAAVPTPATPTASTVAGTGLGTTAVAPPGEEANRVGALFTGAVGPGNHFCSASVIHSGSRNLVLTAAHCVAGTSGVTFAPGYRNGRAPYGTWQVTRMFTADGWQQNSDPDEDFAVLQVAQVNGHDIEDVVGGNPVGTDASFTAQARLYGYPGGAEEPIVCTNATSKADTYQRRIDCPSFPNGTSGGPFVDTGSGQVIGVIGGYQQGGDTDDTSYSAYFDHTIADLCRQASSASS